MKTRFVTLLILASFNAFAEKVDMKSTDYIKHLSRTYIGTNLDYGLYQNRIAVDLDLFEWNDSEPACNVFDPKKLQNTPIETLIFYYERYDEVYGSKYRVEDKHSNWLMTCYRISRPKELVSVFNLAVNKQYAKNIGNAVTIIGISDEQNPEVLILNQDVKEFIPCDDVLLADGKNGEIESGLNAFSKGIMEIVDVVAVGHKDARVRRANGDHVVKPIQDLSSVRQSLEFSSGDTLFIKENDKKVKVVAAGETKIGGVRKILIRKNGKILAVDPGSLIKLKQ